MLGTNNNEKPEISKGMIPLDHRRKNKPGGGNEMRGRLLASLLAAVCLLMQTAETRPVSAKENKKVDIMFTHDLHSHLNSFTTVTEEGTTEVGGFARMKTLIDGQKEKNPDTLLLDAGDFSMGTLVQTVYEQQAAELRMLGELGFDAATLGNHEFDYRSKGLANMLQTAVGSGDVLPQMLVCNVDWEAMEEAGLSEGQQQLRAGFDAYNIKDYAVFQKGNVRVAVLGVFGKDALACAPTCELLFRDPIEAVRETVEEIKEKEDADLIVCISHSGIWEDESKSEDEILAKSVPALDLIVSGHTHTELSEPIVHNDTSIVSVGEYGKKLGSLSMEQKENGRWKVTDYSRIAVTADILADAGVQERVNGFMAAVDDGYLKEFGYTKDMVLAQNDSVAFAGLEELGEIHTEHNLGNLMADAFVYAVENAEGGEPVDVAVVPSGCVRDTYGIGDITVEKVFDSYSLGIGADGVPGYPLISVYLTGEELKIAAEIDASVSDYMTTARLYTSGFQFSFNPNRLILNKVTDASLVDESGGRIELEDDKLYRVVADLYSGQMLSEVTAMSYGLLSIVPKNVDGTPIENFEDVIIMENGRELKAWDAIARYMRSFPDTDGDSISNIPASYSEDKGRKQVENSRNIFDLLKNPNKYAAMIAAVVLILILVVVLLIRLVLKLVKRINRKDAGRLRRK